MIFDEELIKNNLCQVETFRVKQCFSVFNKMAQQRISNNIVKGDFTKHLSEILDDNFYI